MSVDQVRARAASTRKLSNTGVKHSSKSVANVATTFTCDAKCTQVTFYTDPATARTFYLRFDLAASTTVTAANGIPLSSGVPYDVEGGTIVQLISDGAAEDLRVLEALNA
jgi:hypothetical protein